MMYNYLVTQKDEKPFLTNYFEYENHFVENVEMVVYDFLNNEYTTDGINWINIDEDNL